MYGNGSYAQKHRKCYLTFTFSTCYFYTIHCNNVLEAIEAKSIEAKPLYDQINSKLIGSNLH